MVLVGRAIETMDWFPTCELFDGIHDLVVMGAEKICRKMNTNYDILQYVDKDYHQLLSAFIIGQISTPSNEKR